MMLGLADPWVAAAYWLCIFSMLLCVFYGARNWNRGARAPEPEDAHWAEEEEKLEDEL
jgi:hypothetical protein